LNRLGRLKAKRNVVPLPATAFRQAFRRNLPVRQDLHPTSDVLATALPGDPAVSLARRLSRLLRVSMEVYNQDQLMNIMCRSEIGGREQKSTEVDGNWIRGCEQSAEEGEGHRQTHRVLALCAL
jgi:hypothetical protein